MAKAKCSYNLNYLSNEPRKGLFNVTGSPSLIGMVLFLWGCHQEQMSSFYDQLIVQNIHIFSPNVNRRLFEQFSFYALIEQQQAPSLISQCVKRTIMFPLVVSPAYNLHHLITSVRIFYLRIRTVLYRGNINFIK